MSSIVCLCLLGSIGLNSPGQLWLPLGSPEFGSCCLEGECYSLAEADCLMWGGSSSETPHAISCGVGSSMARAASRTERATKRILQRVSSHRGSFREAGPIAGW
jgi:hypothetical protein